MQEKCNGEQSCDWNKESLSLVDPCPATFKYMSIDYRCEEPPKPEPEVAMAPIGMSLEFNAPEKTGKNCQDILAKDLSLKKNYLQKFMIDEQNVEFIFKNHFFPVSILY